jgi:hypothetical protein
MHPWMYTNAESWPLCMNGATERKSQHGPLHDRMAATKPKPPATWVDCCFLSDNFTNTFTNMIKTCWSIDNVIECTCRDMKQSHPRVNRPMTLRNSCKILDKICMMMTRLACNWAIESSYWRMDNNSDVGLLTGYVLYQLPIELEFMDLDTFSCWFGLHPSLLTSW